MLHKIVISKKFKHFYTLIVQIAKQIIDKFVDFTNEDLSLIVQLIKDRNTAQRFHTWLQSNIERCEDASIDEINKCLHVSQAEEFRNELIVIRILETFGLYFITL